jgi:hypothetical protein
MKMSENTMVFKDKAVRGNNAATKKHPIPLRLTCR